MYRLIVGILLGWSLSAGVVADVDEAMAVDRRRNIDLIDFDDALRELSEMDPRASAIVELRYFGGLTVPETAEVLGVSSGTVKRQQRLARAWLHRELCGRRPP